MTKALLISLIFVFSSYVFAEEDCFFRFGYEYSAQTKDGQKQFNCNRKPMKTKYDHKSHVRTNLEKVYKEIKPMVIELMSGEAQAVCVHYCEWNDDLDYNNNSEVTGILFYLEKWCMMNPDSAGLSDSELIFEKKDLNVPATFVTYKKNKPYIQKKRPFPKYEAPRKYDPEDYERP